jgi:hypothetical protein
MKIRTKEAFQNAVNKQLSLRKKEIAMFRLLLANKNYQYERNIINRLIIPQLYSHYEGFIKTASILFLKYIQSTYNPENTLPDNIFALFMREKIKKYSGSNKCSDHVELIRNIRIVPDHIRFNPETIIDTHQNLKAEFLKEIMFICGIPFDVYWEAKSFFIDNILLKNRNLIAHGKLNKVDDVILDQCISDVTDIIEQYKIRLEEKL